MPYVRANANGMQMQLGAGNHDYSFRIQMQLGAGDHDEC
jgi:hypothetical protein